ncbi:MAG TPA: hypothetical protein PLJ26_06355, partial [Candidatus Omnitrophota bacterium]|nr:hypothetical protein [Candidatus Omnitrophota bacterium]
MNDLTIHDLPRAERPREKLMKYGPDALTDVELIALVLRTGCKGENALSLAGRVVRKMDRASLAKAAFDDFVRVKGIGPAKACDLLACVEIGKRIFENKMAAIGELLSPQDVFDALKDVRESKKEHFVVF